MARHIFDHAHEPPSPSTRVRLSPDNRAVTLISDDSGRYELYVTSFLPKGAKVRVSAGGARAPRWAPDGRELFYVSADSHLMVVSVRSQPVVEVGTPMRLFAFNPAATWKNFDVARDGRKFLAIIPQSRGNEQPLTMVVDWTAGLTAK